MQQELNQKLKQELKQLLPVLRRFAFSLTGQMADADDLVQSTIERVLAKSLPDDVELMKWTFRVCRNLWIDEYRSQKVREKATQNPTLYEAKEVNGEKEIHDEMKVDRVLKAMDTIPDDQRSILSLIALNDLSYKEAADTLGIPIGTVMSRLARARRTMADKLNLNHQGATL